MLMGTEEIRRRIPHAGSMCLLHTIETADEKAITARCVSHRDPANPLRAGGRLHAVCGIEYAAQAMAVHASLAEPNKGRPAGGFLASVRDLRLFADSLDGFASDLLIRADRLGAADDSFMYAFEISHNDLRVMSGRVAVKLMGSMPA